MTDIPQQGYAVTIYPYSGGAPMSPRVVGTPKLKRQFSATYDGLGINLDDEQRGLAISVRDRLELYEDGVPVFNGYVITLPKVQDTPSGSRFELACASAPYILWKKLTRDWHFTTKRDLDVIKSLFLETFDGDYALTTVAASLEASSTNVDIISGRLQLKHATPTTFLHPGSARTKTVEMATSIKSVVLNGAAATQRTRDAVLAFADLAMVDGHDSTLQYVQAPSTVQFEPPYAWLRVPDRLTTHAESFDDASVLNVPDNVIILDGSLVVAGATLNDGFEDETGPRLSRTVGGGSTTTVGNAVLAGASANAASYAYMFPTTGDEIALIYASTTSGTTSIKGSRYNARTHTFATSTILVAGNLTFLAAFPYNGGIYVQYQDSGSVLRTAVIVWDSAGALSASVLATAIPTQSNICNYAGSLYSLASGSTTTKYDPGTNTWVSVTNPFGTLPSYYSYSSFEETAPVLFTRTLPANGFSISPIVFDGRAWLTTAATYQVTDGSALIDTNSPLICIRPTTGGVHASFLRNNGSGPYDAWVARFETTSPFQPVGTGQGNFSLRCPNLSRAVASGKGRTNLGTYSFQYYWDGTHTGNFTAADGSYVFRVTAAGALQWQNAAGTWTSLATSLGSAQWSEIRILVDDSNASSSSWSARVFVRGIDNGTITPRYTTSGQVGGMVFGDPTDANQDFSIDAVLFWASLSALSNVVGSATLDVFAVSYNVRRAYLQLTKTQPAGTAVIFEVSLDAGATWKTMPETSNPATPAWMYWDAGQGPNVTVRITLQGTTPTALPSVQAFSLVLANGYSTTPNYLLQTVNFGDADTVGATIQIHAQGDGTNVNVPAGTSITYKVTSDGGAHWQTHPGPGNTITVPPAERGNDIRLQAFLSTTDATKTPAILALKVTWAEPAASTTLTPMVSRDGGATWHTVTLGAAFDFTPYASESPQNVLAFRFDIDTSDVSASPAISGITYVATLDPLPFIRFGTEAAGEVAVSLDPYPLDTYNEEIGPLLLRIIDNLQVDAWWVLDTGTKTYTLHYNVARPAGPTGRLGTEVLKVESRVDGQAAADSVVVGGGG